LSFLIDTNIISEVRKGVRSTSTRKFFPGYVLVQMRLTDDSWYVVRNTPGVTSFVGHGNKPTPLEDDEVKAILKQMEGEAPKVRISYQKGQAVYVTDASRAVAREIADLVQQRAAAGKQTVLGLATGSTPVGVYDELIRLHREEGVSFKTVVTFNLDEYWPMQPDALQSYHRFMREHLFDHIDIPTAAIHIPDGTLARADVLAASHALGEATLADVVR
jgi:hypothetical protein